MLKFVAHSIFAISDPAQPPSRLFLIVLDLLITFLQVIRACIIHSDLSSSTPSTTRMQRRRAREAAVANNSSPVASGNLVSQVGVSFMGSSSVFFNNDSELPEDENALNNAGDARNEAGLEDQDMEGAGTSPSMAERESLLLPHSGETVPVVDVNLPRIFSRRGISVDVQSPNTTRGLPVSRRHLVHRQMRITPSSPADASKSDDPSKGHHDT
ncbi:hypothetical protein HDU76_004342 [Blyttiomyces sp. JEL0837]|nr:hypothetical protein HDU76_004342 [Blyttiomyces sp. JEL0837]